jgi:hypothetical protein
MYIYNVLIGGNSVGITKDKKEALQWAKDAKGSPLGIEVVAVRV